MNEVSIAARFLGLGPASLDSVPSDVTAALAARAREFDDLAFARNRADQEIKSFEVSLSSTKERLENLQEDKKELLESLHHRISEMNNLRATVESNTLTISELRDKHRQLERTREELSVELSTVSTREKSAQLSLQRVQAAKDWLDGDLKRLRSEYNDYRSSVLAQIQEKTERLETTEATYRGLRKSNELLKGTNADKARRLTESMDTIQRLRVELHQEREEFQSEMTSQKRIDEILDLNLKTAQQQIAELESEVEETRESADAQVESLQNALDSERNHAKDLSKRLELAENQLADAVEVTESSLAPRTPDGSVNATGVLSPSASILQELRRSGGSLVDLNHSYQKAKKESARWQRKYEDLKQDMDQVLQELEANAPIIEAEQSEYKRVCDDLVTASERNEQLLAQFRQSQEEIKRLKDTMTDNLGERKLITRQVSDLSHQVQHLLINGQLNSDGEPLMTAQEQAALRTILHIDEDEQSADSDTNKLISQRLLFFKDVAELQQQNADLLRACRSLGRQMEEHENQLQQNYDEMETDVVFEAKEALQILQDELKATTEQLDATKRERDTFRSIAKSEHEPNGHSDKHLESLEAKVSELKAALLDARASSQRQLERSQRELEGLETSFRGSQTRLVQAQAQLELVKSQKLNIEEELRLSQQDLRASQEKVATAKESLTRQEQRAQISHEELLGLREKLEEIRSEAATIRAEKSMWTSEANALAATAENATKESTRLRSVLDEMTNRMENKEASHQAAQTRLFQQIEQLQGTLSQLNRKVASYEDEIKLLTSHRDKDIETWRSRELELVQQVASQRERALLADTAKEPLELQINQLKAQVAAAEKRSQLRALQEHAVKEGNDSELTVALKEKEIAEEHAKELASLVAASEQAVADLHVKYAASEKKYAEDLAAQRSELEAAQANAANMEEQLEKLQKQAEDFDQVKQELETKSESLASLSEAQRKMHADLTESRTSLDSVKAELDAALQQLRETTAARDTSESLRQEKEIELSTLQSQYEHLLGESEMQSSTWQNERVALGDEIRKLRDRNEDLTNTLQELPTSDGFVDVDKKVEFLRQQLDVTRVELENVKQEARSFAFKHAQTEAELVATKAAYTELQSQALDLENAGASAPNTELEPLNARISSLESQNAYYEETTSRLNREMEALKAKYLRSQESVETLESELASKTGYIMHLENEKNDLKAQGTSETLEKELEEAQNAANTAQATLKNLREEAQSKLRKAKVDREELREELFKLKQNLETKEAELKAALESKESPAGSLDASLEAKVAELQADLQSKDTELKQALQSNDTGLIEILESKEAQLSELLASREAELASLRSNGGAAETTATTSDEKDERIAFLESECNKAADEVVEAQSLAQKAKTEATKLEDALKAAEVSLSDMKRQHSELQSLHETKLKEAEEANQQHSALTSMLTSEAVPDEQIMAMRSSLAGKLSEEEMNQFVEQIEKSTKARLKARTNEYVQQQVAKSKEVLLAQSEKEKQAVEVRVSNKYDIKQRLLKKKADSLEEKNQVLNERLSALEKQNKELAAFTKKRKDDGKHSESPKGNRPTVQRPQVNRSGGGKPAKRANQEHQGPFKKRKDD